MLPSPPVHTSFPSKMRRDEERGREAAVRFLPPHPPAGIAGTFLWVHQMVSVLLAGDSFSELTAEFMQPGEQLPAMSPGTCGVPGRDLGWTIRWGHLHLSPRT